MLKDINNRRPDRQLERNLVFLAYTIMFLSLSLFALFIYPQHFIYIVVSLVVFNVLCILITIRILKVSENAIGFGTLAAELLNDKNRYYRVDNSEGEAIIINRAAMDYFQNLPILTFLEKNIIPSQANKMDLQKLVSAVNKLQEITINLSISPNKNSIFVAEEWLRINVKPIYLNKADIFEDKFSLNKIRKETYLFWTVENITAYKNMDNVFKNEMTSLHNFLDFLPVGLYTCNADGKIEYINNLLAENLNTDKNNAIGRKIDKFIVHKPELLHTPNGTYNDNILFQTSHGIKEAFVKQQNVRENNELKTRGVVIFDLPNDTDLTTRLNTLTDKFEHLLDTAPLGIIFLDNKQNIMQTNSYVCNFFSQPESALLGTKINKYFDDKTYDKIYEASLAYSKNQTEEFSCDSVLTINEENRNISLNIYPLQMPHSASKNNINGMIIYLRDTSNRRNLEMQVAQAQKMQAFGQLAGGVAHDFNNLLTAVVGYCDLLIRRHGIGDPSFTDLVELKNNVTRAIGVSRQLLTISRQQPLNPKLIDITEAITENDHLIARALGEKIKLKINYGSDLGYVRVDTVQFSQVLLNLAINARDAMNGKGTLTISALSERLNQPYQFGADTINPGDFIVVSVADTGCGIPPENIERIFEPFFSTKKNILNSGTGLGLAMVDSIVRQMGGFLKLHSEVGKGTTFEIYLPSYESTETAPQQPEEPKEKVILNKSGKAAMRTMPLLNNEKVILGLNISEFDSQRNLSGNLEKSKILFVEDEDAVRAVGVRGLKQRGFDVTDCISAENALEHIEAGETFDMMITDMMMPGMSGAELANIMHQKSPNTIIILASGYSEEIARKELAGSKDFYFISKPYGIDDLHKKVKDLLTPK